MNNNRKSNTPLNRALGKVNRQVTDKSSSSYVYPATYHISNNGYGYIVYSESKKKSVELAINYNIFRDQTDEGNRDTSQLTVTTTKRIEEYFSQEPEAFLLLVDGSWIALKDIKSYNATADNYEYTAELLENINSSFIRVDLDDEELSQNSIPKWMAFSTFAGVPIYPKYLTPYNLNTPYVLVEVLDTEATHQVAFNSNKLYQNKTDMIRLVAVNMTTRGSQDFLYELIQYGFVKDGMGVLDIVNWGSSYNSRQGSFGIVANIKLAEMRVNYNMVTDTSRTEQMFNQVLASINGEEVELYNNEIDRVGQGD